MNKRVFSGILHDERRCAKDWRLVLAVKSTLFGNLVVNKALFESPQREQGRFDIRLSSGCFLADASGF